jgi:hypothetical protein
MNTQTIAKSGICLLMLALAGCFSPSTSISSLKVNEGAPSPKRIFVGAMGSAVHDEGLVPNPSKLMKECGLEIANPVISNEDYFIMEKAKKAQLFEKQISDFHPDAILIIHPTGSTWSGMRFGYKDTDSIRLNVYLMDPVIKKTIWKAQISETTGLKESYPTENERANAIGQVFARDVLKHMADDGVIPACPTLTE